MDIDISVLRLMEREKEISFELLASAIEEALQRRLEALRAADDDDARRRRLLRLMDEIESDTTDADRARTAQVQEELYDDRGLPA